MDHLISARQQDLIIINKKRELAEWWTLLSLQDHWVKLKGSEKKDKYLNLTREWKKLWNMKMTIILIIIGALGTVTKRLTKGLEVLEIGDHPNYCIIEISQNTEKSPGDLRRLTVTQTSVKDHHLMLMWKTL